jgi:hypothetical protein
MMGCCLASGRKFIDREASVDRGRLKAICDDLEERFAGKEMPSQAQDRILAQVRECDCPCHKDGINCLC